MLELGTSKIVSHSYLLCGWHTHSDIPLTCIPTVERGSTNVEVMIRVMPGHSPMFGYADKILFKHSTKSSFIGVKGVADFEIRSGREIRIWPTGGAAQKDIEIFLLGPAWATLCHQRGMLPLHASAIRSRRGVAAFVGHRGAGKSTTAALLGSLGYEVFADDILAVGFNHNYEPGAWPYLRRFKLQGDSVAELDLTPTELVSETLDNNKYFVLPNRWADYDWSVLEQVYLLENDPTVERTTIDQIKGAEAVRTLIDQTYHFKFILGSGQFSEHLAFCTKLASKVAIFRLRRPQSCDIGRDFGSLLCAHIESGNVLEGI